jgi:hypothetical protein
MSTALEASRPPSSSPRDKVGSFLRTHKFGALSVLVWLITSALLWARFWSALRTPFYETGDLASDSIMVSLAKHFRLNHGHYSQFNFFHPGAAMFYVEALGQWVFYNLFHLFPTESNAQLATLLIVNAAFIAGSAFCLGVVFRSPRVIFATSFAILLYASIPSMSFMQTGASFIAQLWVPIQTIWCFVFFLCALIYLFAKRPSLFIVLGISATLLAQRYFGLVPIALIGLVAGFYVAWKFDLPSRRRDLRNGIIAVVILCIPNILGVVLDWPWQFVNYAKASRHGVHGYRGIRATFDFVGQFWRIHHGYIFALLIVIACGITFMIWKRPASPTRNGYLGIMLAILGSTVVAIGFSFFVVSDLVPLEVYQLAFYDAAPILFYVLLAILVLRLGTAYLALPAVLLFADFGPPAQSGNGNVLQAQAAIVHSANGKQIEYVSQNIAQSWPMIAALQLVDIYSGVNSCVQEASPSFTFIFTTSYVCTSAQSGQRVQFVVNPTSPWPNSTTVYKSPDLNVVKLNP